MRHTSSDVVCRSAAGAARPSVVGCRHDRVLQAGQVGCLAKHKAGIGMRNIASVWSEAHVPYWPVLPKQGNWEAP